MPFLNSTNNWWYGCCPTSTKNLYLQINNLARDNKKQCILTFLFMLTAQKIFQEIQVRFLLVKNCTLMKIYTYISTIFSSNPKQQTHYCCPHENFHGITIPFIYSIFDSRGCWFQIFHHMLCWEAYEVDRNACFHVLRGQ